MSKPFVDVQGLFNSVQSELPPGMDLRKFSQFANRATGSNEFDQGDNSWFGQKLKELSAGIDNTINETGLPDYTSELGRKAFEYVGANPELGADLGQGLPRGVANFAPMFIPGVGQGYALGSAMGLTALDTYEKSGSPVQAAVSAGTIPLMNAGGKFATDMLAKSPFVRPIVEEVLDSATGKLIQQTYLTGLKDKSLNYLAAQVGANATAELTNEATSRMLNGHGAHEGMSATDIIASSILGNVPYALGDIKNNFLPKKIVTNAREVSSRRVEDVAFDAEVELPSIKDARGKLLDVRRAQELAGHQDIKDPVEKQEAIDRTERRYAYDQDILNGKTAAEAFYKRPEEEIKQISSWPLIRVDDLKSVDQYAETVAQIDLMVEQINKDSIANNHVQQHLDAEFKQRAFGQEDTSKSFEQKLEELKQSLIKEDIALGIEPEEAMANAIVGLRNSLVEDTKQTQREREAVAVKNDEAKFEEFIDSPEWTKYNELADAGQVEEANALRKKFFEGELADKTEAVSEQVQTEDTVTESELLKRVREAQEKTNLPLGLTNKSKWSDEEVFQIAKELGVESTNPIDVAKAVKARFNPEGRTGKDRPVEPKVKVYDDNEFQRVLSEDRLRLAKRKDYPKNKVKPELKVPKKPISNEESIKRNLRLKGYSEPEIEVWSKFFTNIMDKLNVPGMKLGSVFNDGGPVGVYGLAIPDQRLVWLAAERHGREDLSTTAAVLSHEIGHLLQSDSVKHILPKKVRDAQEALNKYFEFSPDKAHTKLHEWTDMLPQRYQSIFRDLLDTELGKTRDEMDATATALWAVSDFVAKEEMVALGLHMPREIRTWSKELSGYAMRALDVFKKFIKGKDVNAQPKLMEVQELVSSTKEAIFKHLQESELKLAELDQFMSGGTDRLYALKTSTFTQKEDGIYFAKQRDPLDIQETGRFRSAMQDIFRQTYTLAQGTPVFKRAVDALFRHAPLTNSLFNHATGHLYGGQALDGSVRMSGPEAKMIKATERGTDANLNRLVSDIMSHWQSKEDKFFDLNELLKDNPTYPVNTNGRKLGDAFKALPKEKQQAAVHRIESSMKMHQAIGRDTVLAEKEVGKTLAYSAVKSNVADELFPQIRPIVDKAFEALEVSNSTDPVTQQQVAATLKTVESRLGNPEAYKAILDIWASTKKNAEDLSAYYASKPGHLSMSQKGKWLVHAYQTVGGKQQDAGHTIVNSIDDVRVWQNELKKQGITQFSEPTLTANREYSSFDHNELSMMRTLEQRRKDIINQYNIPQDLKDNLLSMTSIEGELARIKAAEDLRLPAFMQNAIKGGRKGSENILRDMVEVQVNYAKNSARMNASRISRAHIAFEKSNPELSRYPDEVTKFERSVDNYFRPESDLSRFVTGMNAKFYLAGNIPGMVTEAFQPVLTMLPEIVNSGLSPARATLVMGKSMKDAAKFSGKLLLSKVGLMDESKIARNTFSHEEADLLDYLGKQGHLTHGYLSDVLDTNAESAIDLQKLSNTGTGFSPVGKAMNVTNNLLTNALKFYGSTQRHNTIISALTGFRLAKERMGKRYDKTQAFEEAVDFIRATTFSGGRANRPLAQGDLGAAGAAAYGLSSYTLGWTNMAARYIQHGWKGEHLNLTSQQKASAKSAALTLFGTQLAAAGTLGLPFVGAALKILEKATGKDLTGSLYANMNQMLDDDDKDGGGLTNIVMNGAANGMLANSGIPIDIGSRMGVNSIFGLNSYDGFNGDAVFGPTAGIVSNVLAGIKSAAQGDLGGFAKALTPNAAKKAVNYMLNDNQVKTSQGSIVPTSSIEDVAYVAGFNPQSVSALQKYQALKRSRDEENSNQNMREASEILDAIQTDPNLAKAKLQNAVDKGQGMENAQTIARRVANQAVDQAYPLDIRETMSKKSGSHLSEMARILGVSIPEANQVARLQYKNNILTMLGQRPQQISRETVMRDQTSEAYSPFVRP